MNISYFQKIVDLHLVFTWIVSGKTSMIAPATPTTGLQLILEKPKYKKLRGQTFFEICLTVTKLIQCRGCEKRESIQFDFLVHGLLSSARFIMC